jgi:hydroxymethylpyrimidine/phosphomethylpyrimidine kinase
VAARNGRLYVARGTYPRQDDRVTIPVALTIAGSDSGGGAGIQADLKTFQAYGVFGTSAITAITVQNTLGVTGVHAIPEDIVVAQIHAVASDFAPAACKTGMLATAALVTAVAKAIEAEGLTAYVLDPVMVATSGDRLLDEGAERAILERLMPLATVITPNLDEASILVGYPVRDVPAMERAAQDLMRRGAHAVLLKGGHLSGDCVLDLLADADGHHAWQRPRIDTRNTHGTGCTLSAAIAAGLAHGRPLRSAVESALDFVHHAIVTAPDLGSGSGPLNHFHPPSAGPTE